jgi:hypothetical protein
LIFATPDFGAGGMIVLILGGVGLVVVCITILCIRQGMLFLQRPAPARKWPGVVLILSGLLLPICCCSGPSVLFRLRHETPPLGRYPNGVIREGMSPDEVRARLGVPHQVFEGDPERVTFLYWLDAIELSWLMVSFGPNGKVANTAGD